MNAQIIPFQTKSDRLLALARSWYRHFRDDYQQQGRLVDRAEIIEKAAVEALVENDQGWRYWEEAGRTTDDQSAKWYREFFRDDKWGHTERLKCRLDDCLHGKWHRMKAVPPRHPRCSKATREKPVATVIPFRVRCTTDAPKSAAR
jgi:hypothetical protein